MTRASRARTITMLLALALLAVVAVVAVRGCTDDPEPLTAPVDLVELPASERTDVDAQPRAAQRARAPRAGSAAVVAGTPAIRVVDSTGAPVVGATVLDAASGAVLVASDTDGVVPLPTEPIPEYLRVTKDDFAEALLRIDPRQPPKWPLDVVLALGGTLAGRVVMAEKGALSGVRVLATPPGAERSRSAGGGDSYGRHGVETVTDNDGEFEFRGLANLRYTLDVMEPGLLLEAGFGGCFSTRLSTKIELVVVPTAVVRFRLIDALTGAPVWNIGQVGVSPKFKFVDCDFPRPSSPCWTGERRTHLNQLGSDGYTLISIIQHSDWPLPPGRVCRARISSPGYVDRDVELPVEDVWSAEPTIHEIRMEPVAGSGVVRALFRDADGQPLPGRAVSANVATPDGVWVQSIGGFSDANGAVSTRLPAGSYVHFTNVDFPKEYSFRAFEIADGRDVELPCDLEGALLDLRVTDRFHRPLTEGSGLLVAHAPGEPPVEVQEYGRGLEGQWETLSEARSEPGTGLYRVARALVPGPRSIELRRRVVAPPPTRVDLRAGHVTTVEISIDE